jgi:hypothetical protein
MGRGQQGGVVPLAAGGGAPRQARRVIARKAGLRPRRPRARERIARGRGRGRRRAAARGGRRTADAAQCEDRQASAVFRRRVHPPKVPAPRELAYFAANAVTRAPRRARPPPTAFPSQGWRGISTGLG